MEMIVELIFSKEYYCWSVGLRVASLLLVSLLLLPFFASRCRTALPPSVVLRCCDFLSFKTWVKLLFLIVALSSIVTSAYFFQHL